jgi:hypothetical protein
MQDVLSPDAGRVKAQCSSDMPDSIAEAVGSDACRDQYMEGGLRCRSAARGDSMFSMLTPLQCAFPIFQPSNALFPINLQHAQAVTTKRWREVYISSTCTSRREIQSFVVVSIYG